MKFFILFLLLIIHVDLRHHNKEYLQDLFDNGQDFSSPFQREKKYSSRKKVLDDADEPTQHTHSSKTNNRSRLSDAKNRNLQTTTQENYLEEASLCINEYDIKTEQLVKVKEFKNGAHIIRIVRIVMNHHHLMVLILKIFVC